MIFYLLSLILPYLAIAATLLLSVTVVLIIYSQPARISAAGFAV